MKYITFILLAFIPFQISFSQLSDYHIYGRLKNVDDGTTFYLSRKNEKGRMDTVAKSVAINGQFLFSGTIPLAAEFYFIQVDKSISSEPKLILLENAIFEISGSLSNWPRNVYVSGGEANKDYNDLKKLIEEPLEHYTRLQYIVDSIRAEIWRRKADVQNQKNDDDLLSLEKVYGEKTDRALQEYQNTMKEFVFQNRESLYTPHLIIRLNNTMTLAEKEEAYSSLSARSRESFYGRQLKQHLEEMRVASSLKMGNKAPDFCVTTIDGDTIQLMTEAAKNKVTILDFWASWCTPCRTKNKHLKEIYNRFSSKGLGIVGISTDRNEAALLKAMREDGCPWVQISDMQNNSQLSKMYSIRHLPSTFILNSKGVIIGVDWVNLDMEAKMKAILD